MLAKELMHLLYSSNSRWRPLNMAYMNTRPIPKHVNGKKAWKMRGKVPTKKYRRM